MTTGTNPWPVNAPWGHLKGLDSSPYGTTFDQHMLKFAPKSAVTVGEGDGWNDATIAGVISGIKLRRGMDGIGYGSGPNGALVEYSWFQEIRDDTCEADWSNGVMFWYRCFFDQVFAGTSTRGSADRSTLQMTYDSCVITLKQRAWRPAGGELHCDYAADGNDGAGNLLGHGATDKRNNNSPRVHFRDCVVYIEAPPVGPTSCDGSGNAWASMGFRDEAYCTAENTTFLFARCPLHAAYPVNYTADTFWPLAGPGVQVLPYQGNESILSSAVQNWHNDVPQMGSAAAVTTSQSVGILQQ
jgi:hypothetical protein